MEHNTSHVLKWSLIAGLIIILNLFFNYAISVAYKAPDYDEFCKAAMATQPITTQQACLNVGGRWTTDVTPENKNFQCDATFTCSQNYQVAEDKYERNAFVTRVVLGVVILVVSFFMTNLVIAYGLALGGVLSFVIASMFYWSAANDYIKLAILAVALVALIVLAMKKFSKNKNSFDIHDR